LQKNYLAAQSSAVVNRNNNILFWRTNTQGYYAPYIDYVPEQVKNLLVAKEDRTFWRHFGINPVSLFKNLISNIGIGQRPASSTITQQLAKILLGNVNRRNFKERATELFAAISLELFESKDQIITEYANSIYFGNRLQGISAASQAYFAVSNDKLSDAQIFQLLAAVSDPNGLNPTREENIPRAKILAENLGIAIGGDFTTASLARSNLADYFAHNAAPFELAEYLGKTECNGFLKTTIDSDINKKLRKIIADNLEILGTKKAKNAAAIIISLAQNEVLALTGSPNPDLNQNGYKINMLKAKRQIGSTIKPFIYLKAFEKGMRPYTLIDDREYKYPADAGYSIYPENYDRQYHGLMTAHYALSNSINVAAVKTLEFAGNQEFGDFVQNKLAIPVQQDYKNYQMGVALGVMETDIVNLAQAFTIFPNNGFLRNLKLFDNNQCNTVFAAPQNKTVAKLPYVQMINKILADRVIAQDQFSYASYLNLPASNYALKTGTSHNYTDSWIIGYTPDFLVAVWVGNADASAMEGLSGQLGAGRIWQDVMEMMLASIYNKKTPFDFSKIIEYHDGANIEYGLVSDDYEKAKIFYCKIIRN